MCTMSINNQLNGIELSFERKPAKEILESIKAAGFRWHNQRKIWYAKQSADRLSLAEKLSGSNTTVSTPAAPTTKANKYGVKVGDLFYCSWGYEQTNVDFFQVIGLKGECSVLIREVSPKIIDEKPTCGMAADRTYEIPDHILPPCRSVFVEDNENGDLKRVKIGYNQQPYFNVGRKGGYQDTAYPYTGQTVYESWYY